MFFKTGAVRNVAILIIFTSVLESLFNKIAGLTACNFISISSLKILQHKCFPENIAKFLPTAFFIEQPGGL